MSKTIYVIQMNHFDPIWRRCWDRAIEYRGQRFASYADIQQAIIDDWLSTAEDGPATFVLEQTVSLRKYLQRCPDRIETLRRLAREGRFELLAAGEVIPDANLPLGESLVRNLLYGILWAEETLGVPITTGCRTDGFGSSAQIPQIFRRCEVKWLPFVHNREPDNDYWRGLDGTAIYVRPPYPLRFAGWGVKLAPCAQCSGHGCAACHGRGFDQNHRVTINEWPEVPDDGELAVVVLGAEETLPCLDIVSLVANRAAGDTDVTYRFGTCKDLAAHLADAIEKVDNPPPQRVSANPDLALSSSGCWVTRVKLKQRNRRCEHQLLAAETLAALAWLHGADYPHEALTEAWRTLVFTHFHDAITATHVDPAYDELMDMYDTVEIAAAKVAADAGRAVTIAQPAGRGSRDVAVFNTLSWARTAVVQVTLDDWTARWATAEDDAGPLPVYDLQKDSEGRVAVTFLARDVPALAGKTVRLIPQAEAPRSIESSDSGIENEHFRVTADEHGITGILDQQTGRELIDAAGHYAGELILERDYGDPWATRSPDRARELMHGFTRRQAVRRIPGGAEIVFTGKHPGNFHDFEVNWLTWRQHVVLRDGLPYVEFITDVDWDTHNRRLRIAFPTVVKSDTGHYEIPYGTLERPRYDEFTYGPGGVNGDWPTIHWAAPASSEGSAAIINRGEPSYRIENGTVLVSLLRSPGTPWCLHEPEFYRLPLFEGMRDAGRHRFSLALYPFPGEWNSSDVTRQA